MYQTEVEVFSDLCYYTLTTLLGTQTLGEEYCDIMQINSSSGTFPSLPVSLLFHAGPKNAEIIGAAGDPSK